MVVRTLWLPLALCCLATLSASQATTTGSDHPYLRRELAKHHGAPPPGHRAAAPPTPAHPKKANATTTANTTTPASAESSQHFGPWVINQQGDGNAAPAAAEESPSASSEEGQHFGPWTIGGDNTTATTPSTDDGSTTTTTPPEEEPAQATSTTKGGVGRVTVPQTNYSLSRIAYGGLHFPEFEGDADKLILSLEKALSLGITTMDLADVYGWYEDGKGKSNDVFAKALSKKPELRDQMELVCKFGIRLSGGYRVDTSAEWIKTCMNNYLTQFNTTHCDVFMIHNPSNDINNDEVAQTFKELYDEGKVRMFGVSNFHEWEYKPLQEAMKANGLRLSVHEMETSVLHPDKITDGTVEYAVKEDMVVLGWGPLGGEPNGGKNLLFGSQGKREQHIVDVLTTKGTTVGGQPDQVAVTWLLNNPNQIIPILGTTRPERIEEQSVGAQKLTFNTRDYDDILPQLGYN